MAPEPDDLDRHDIVRRLFVQITATLEDGAEIAVEGQGAALSPTEQLDRAERLRNVGQQVELLAGAIQLIVSDQDLA